MGYLLNILKAKDRIHALKYHVFFWMFSNRAQKNFLNSLLKEDNPHYDFLKYYLDK